MHKLNQHFDNIYLLYITDFELQQAKYKLEKRNIKVQYFKGVNGRESLQGKYKTFSKKDKITTLGAFGHLHSFINIMKDAIKNNKNKKILILEPDIYFRKDFDEHIDKILQLDYKLLYLGCTQISWNGIEFRGNYYLSHLTFGTFAIALDCSIFKEYLELLQSLERPSDTILFKLQKKYKGQCFCAYPNLIICDITHSSTFKGHNQMERMKKIRWDTFYDFERIYHFKIKKGWVKMRVMLNSNFGYKKGFLKIDGVPLIRLPNVLFKENIIHIKTNSNALTLTIKSKGLFIQNIKCTNIDEKNIKIDMRTLRSMRQMGEMQFTNYYLDNLTHLTLTADATFVNALKADIKLLHNCSYFDDLFKNKNEVDYKSTNTVLYLASSTIEYEHMGYTIRTHDMLSSLDNINVVVASQYGYPVNRKNPFSPSMQRDFCKDHIVYKKIFNNDQYNDCRETNDSIQFLIKYINQIIQVAKQVKPKVIHACTNYLNGMAGLYAAKVLNIPFVYEVRGLWHESIITFNKNLYKSDVSLYQKNMDLFLCARADKVITLNEILKKKLIKYNIDSDKIIIVKNGVSINNIKNSTRYNIGKRVSTKRGKFTIGYIGSILEYEGLQYIIRLLDYLKRIHKIQVQFKVIGKGYYLHTLKELANRLNVQTQIIFMDPLPHSKAINMYNDFDLVIYPRINCKVCRTTTSLKIFEAMSMSKPIIVSSLPPYQEIVNGENGLLFKPGNMNDLINKTLSIINDVNFRDKLGDNARNYVLSNYLWKKNVNALKQFYDSL